MRYWWCLLVIVATGFWGTGPAGAGTSDAQAALDAGDYRKARVLFREPAEAGDLHAQFSLGRLLVQHSEMEGLEWIRKSAKAGHIPAQMRMARYCLLGHYMKDDDQAYAGWLIRIVAHGPAEQAKYVAASVDAKKLLSDAYIVGNGVPKDESKATALLKQAADDGQPLALYGYAERLMHGKGVTKDLVESHKYYVLAWKAPYVINWFGRDVNAGKREALTVRKMLTSAQFAESRARVRAWLAKQKAGEIGMGFQYERKLSHGLRKLETDESEGSWAMILAPYSRSERCRAPCIMSRKAIRGTPDETVWTEQWTLDECGKVQTYTVRLTRALSRSLTIQIGDEVRYTGEMGVR